jgi:tetratricopeptide (TPR) repeat protein
MQAMQTNPQDPRIYQNLGINMKRAGKLQEALAYYQKAIELEPTNSAVLYNTGVVYNIKSDFPSAIAQLELAISNNRENIYAYLALGDAYERNNDPKHALAVYRELNGLGVKVKGLREKI